MEDRCPLCRLKWAEHYGFDQEGVAPDARPQYCYEAEIRAKDKLLYEAGELLQRGEYSLVDNTWARVQELLGHPEMKKIVGEHEPHQD